MSRMDHKASRYAALLDAAGIPVSVVGPNEIAVIDADKAHEVIRRLSDSQHDELGITDLDGTHVAILPVSELPPTPPHKTTAPALPFVIR
jgi:hypothetical protein